MSLEYGLFGSPSANSLVICILRKRITKLSTDNIRDEERSAGCN